MPIVMKPFPFVGGALLLALATGSTGITDPFGNGSAGMQNRAVGRAFDVCRQRCRQYSFCLFLPRKSEFLLSLATANGRKVWRLGLTLQLRATGCSIKLFSGRQISGEISDFSEFRRTTRKTRASICA